MKEIESALKKYDYAFPKELIAQAPASPRDGARLLISSRKGETICESTFLHLGDYLPKRAVLVFNQTKVIPARLALIKETGGKVRVLYLSHDMRYGKFLADRDLMLGSRVFLTKHLFFFVAARDKPYYLLKPSFPIKKLMSILQRFGKTPIPPYIKQTPLTEKELKENYQSIFARRQGSVAAPTASLHFTRRLMHRLKKQGFSLKFITLHVGLGTFAPLREEQLKKGKLHEEYYEIDKKTAHFLNRAKKEGRPIIGVGTTVIRTLETAAAKNGFLQKLRGSTDLFIREGYRFRFIDGMITNFHVPRSSLFMLVAAFIGRKKLRALYQEAIKRKFRLFSFGDGMLLNSPYEHYERIHSL